jgi:hypothetical protein
VSDTATIAPVAIDIDIAKAAAGAFRKRDKLAAEMAILDLLLRQHTRDYGEAMRTWGLTPLMLRKACEARGLLDKEA